MNFTDYSDINNLLQALSTRLLSLFDDKLIGIYLYGSLVWGDFDYNTSDIDLLVVTTTDIDENIFSQLNEVHADLIKTFNHWNDRIEIAYVSKAALQSFKTQKSAIAIISPGEPFNIKEAGIDWLLNWYFIREKSITLFGPDRKTIIEPISEDEYLEAVKNQALAWHDWITHTKHSLKYQSYAILTMCRALYSLDNKEQTSKIKAALWAQKKFPAWANVIHEAIQWRTDNPQVDPLATYPEIERCAREMVDLVRK